MRNLPLIVLVFVLIAQIFAFFTGCDHKSGVGVDSDVKMENTGKWFLYWGDSKERTFTYTHAFAGMNADGSMTMLFFQENQFGYPMAMATIKEIDMVSPNVPANCDMMIAFSSELSDIAISPLDPLQTHVIFTKKDTVSGGKLSGSFQGELSTSNFPDLVKVTIKHATFSDVCMVSQN